MVNGWYDGSSPAAFSSFWSRTLVDRHARERRATSSLQAASAWTTMTSWLSPRQVTLQARTGVGLALDSAKSVRVVGEPQPERATSPRLETSASCLPSGETVGVEHALARRVEVGHEVALAPVRRFGRERRLVLLDASSARCRSWPEPAGSLTPTPRIERRPAPSADRADDRERRARGCSSTSVAVAL